MDVFLSILPTASLFWWESLIHLLLLKSFVVFFKCIFYLEDNGFIVLCFCCTPVWGSCMYAHIPFLSSLTLTSHPSRLSQHRAEPAVLHGSFPPSVLHMVVYMCRCYSLNSSHPLLPPLCPHAHSLHLCLFSCPANRFISTVFLEGNWLLPLGYLFPIHLLAFLSRTSCIPVFFCVQLIFFFFLVQSPGWEDPLEKGMATHSSILIWRIPWTEVPGGLQSIGLQRVGHNWVTNTATTTVNNIQILCSFTVLSHLTLVVDVTGLHLYNCVT